MQSEDSLQSLGWRPFFASQLPQEGGDELRPVRVLAVHRGRVEVAGENGTESVALSGPAADLAITVGDWLLVDDAGPRVHSVLERMGVFKRRAAGTAGETQSTLR